MEFESNLKVKVMGNYIAIQPVNKEDFTLFQKIENKESIITGVFKTQVNERTYKQLKTVWKLVRCIWDSQNIDPDTGRAVSPTKDELYDLYLDLLEEYAEKRPSGIHTDKLVPVHISTADTIAGAKFIQGLMFHLANYCDIPDTEQTKVRGLLTIWEQWRGTLQDDPLDYYCSESEWYEKHTVSQASFKGGAIQKAHIVSRGSDQKDIDEPWNWIALLPKEHIELQHMKGWDAFLEEYPHLKGRVLRARRIAGKLQRLNA